MITPENRKEFDDLGHAQVLKRVENSTYTDPQKLREAREYLDKKNPAWVSAKAARWAAIFAAIALLVSLGSLYLAKLSYDLAVLRDERELSEKTPAIDIQMQPAGVSAASMVVSITNRSDRNITPLTITAVHSVELGDLYIASAAQNIQLMRSTLSLDPMGMIKPKGTAVMKATLAGVTDGTSESFTPGAEVQFSIRIRLSDDQDSVRTFDVMRRVRLP